MYCIDCRSRVSSARSPEAWSEVSCSFSPSAQAQIRYRLSRYILPVCGLQASTNSASRLPLPGEARRRRVHVSQPRRGAIAARLGRAVHGRRERPHGAPRADVTNAMPGPLEPPQMAEDPTAVPEAVAPTFSANRDSARSAPVAGAGFVTRGERAREMLRLGCIYM
jgi:hypothetical protein